MRNNALHFPQCEILIKINKKYTYHANKHLKRIRVNTSVSFWRTTTITGCRDSVNTNAKWKTEKVLVMSTWSVRHNKIIRVSNNPTCFRGMFLLLPLLTNTLVFKKTNMSVLHWVGVVLFLDALCNLMTMLKSLWSMIELDFGLKNPKNTKI